MDEQVDERARTTDVAACSSERLAESAHLHVDVLRQAVSFGQPAPVLTIKAGGMRFIQHEPGAVALL